MVASTPTSTSALQMQLMAELVAASATFQTLVDESSEALALNHVYYPIALDDGTQPIPRAIVTDAGESSIGFLGSGSTGRSGNFFVTFEMDIPVGDDDDNEKQQYIYFQNKLGAIKEEMMTKVVTRVDSPSGGTHLNVTSIEVDEGPFMEDTEEMDREPGDGPPQPRWWVVLICTWQG